MVLTVFDVEKQKVKALKFKDERLLMPNLGILPAADDQSVIVGVRRNGWLAEAMASYEEATKGPIVVYEGSEDFLKWDKIGVEASKAEIVKVDLGSGKVTDVLPESAYTGLRLSDEDKYLSYYETFRLKTSYNRNDGTVVGSFEPECFII